MFYNPYERIADGKNQWIKTNFHTHAGVCEEGNCGELPMNEVIRAYKKAKYGAVAISNHNLFLEHPQMVDGLSVLDAVEYSKHPHMVQVGVTEYWDVDHQQAIDNTIAKGGFIILCHPNWMHKEYWKWKEIDVLTGYTGIEIFNPVIYTLSGSGLALDTWDHLLTTGKRVFGFGDDDFHQWRDIERAYNVIYAKSGSYSDIKAAVEAGCFYVSSGVALRSFSFCDNIISVQAGLFTSTYVNEYEYRFVGKNGQLLKSSHGEGASYSVTGEEGYVRVEVTAEHGAKMFLQPVFLQ